jgi:RND family efflux transporter MFP subunit
MRQFLLRVFVSTLSIYFSVSSSAQSDISVSAASMTALGIETDVVRSDAAISNASATGIVIAPPGVSHSVTVPFDAVMLEPLVLPGMKVSAGQNIALLKSPNYSSAYAELENQRFTAEHMDELAARAIELADIGLRSREEMDEAEHDAKSSKLNFNAIESQLSGLKKAQGAGEFYVAASSGGIVTHVAAQSGEPVMGSQPLVTLFDGDRYWARVQLPETKALQVNVGDKVSTDHSARTAVVVAVDPEIDPLSRSVEIFVDLPAEDDWRVGQLVSLTFFPAKNSGDVLTVPARSIVRINKEVFVFVKTDTGFKTVPVTIQTQSRNVVAVTGNLSVGTPVAVSGLAALKNIVEGG